jgi:uncharacterized protein (TIGR03067 family)
MRSPIAFLLPVAVGLGTAGSSPGLAGEPPNGTWAVVSSEQDGKPFAFPAKGTVYSFADGKVTIESKKGERKAAYTFTADPTKDPMEIDLVEEVRGRKVLLRGIYRVEKGRMVVCVGLATGSGEDKSVEGPRPTVFKSGRDVQLLTFEPGKD